MIGVPRPHDDIGWSVSSAIVDHGTLAGLSDDDHAQYLLLAGRSPAQTVAGTVNFGDATLGVADTAGNNWLRLDCAENLSADRILSFVTGDSARTITLSGNPTLADWFDQAVKTTSTPQFRGLKFDTYDGSSNFGGEERRIQYFTMAAGETKHLTVNSDAASGLIGYVEVQVGVYNSGGQGCGYLHFAFGGYGHGTYTRPQILAKRTGGSYLAFGNLVFSTSSVAQVASISIANSGTQGSVVLCSIKTHNYGLPTGAISSITLSLESSGVSGTTYQGTYVDNYNLTMTDNAALNQNLLTTSSPYFAQVGIGTSPSVNAMLHSSKTWSVATAGEQFGAYISTFFGIADTGMKQGLRVDAYSSHTSGTLAEIYGAFIRAGGAASGGTTTKAVGVFIRNDTGAGSNVTGSYGLWVADPVDSGATTNCFQIYISTPTAGSGLNYSIYSEGGANYFGGPLQITGAYSDIQSYSADTVGAYLYLNKSRHATKGSHTIVQNGDYLGGILFRGSNGTGWDAAAYITCSSDGTPGASADMPGRLVFWTSADGSATPTERMRITSAGYVGIGGTPAALLDLQNTARMKFQVSATTSFIEMWKDATPSYAVSAGMHVPGASLTSDLIFSTYNGSAWAEKMRITNAGRIRLDSVPQYASEAAATGAGLTTGDVYKVEISGIRYLAIVS